MTPTPRVVLVEDSPTMRVYLGTLLWELGFTVAAAAEGVGEAERLVQAHRPDLVLSDIQLSDGDGLDLTRRLLAERGLPIVLITSQDHRNPELVFQAMQAGALEVLPKPPSRTDPTFPSYRRRLDTTLRTLAGVPVVRRRGRGAGPSALPPMPPAVPGHTLQGAPLAVLIGASTGGPVLIGDLLRALRGRRLSYALVAQHIVPDFADSFRAWLADHVGLPVRMARDNEAPEPGGIYTIPGGAHLQLTSDERFRVVPDRVLAAPHVPSIDALFESVPQGRAPRVLALLLSGMGHDGTAGLLSLRRAGALTVAQAPATAAVDSMPMSAIAGGGALHVLAPADIEALLRQLPATESSPRDRGA